MEVAMEDEAVGGLEEPRWLRGLNERQRLAVEHEGGPLLVVAGAGSGKTRVLASRVARLIDTGTQPDRILLLTFTRRAAAEMLQRVGSMLARRSPAKVWGGTFHSVGSRLLRRHGSTVGLDPGFTILDQSDAADLIGAVRADLGLAEAKRRTPKQDTILAIYSRMVNAQQSLADVLDRHFPWCTEEADALREVIREYATRKRTLGVVDYDDLLLYLRAVLRSNAGDAVRSRFDHVLVDEYQDTNAVQADILEDLAGERGGVTVVGDDAQAIYGFRAASSGNMLAFPDRFPGTTVVKLEQNYRSTPEILAAANGVMEPADGIHRKRLWSDRAGGVMPRLVSCFDEAAQSSYVCDRVLELREQGLALRDQAVLFRTGHHSAGLELELAARDIPFVKFGGLKFLEAGHIKDLLALLRILDNPRDDLAWRRTLLALPGIGPATTRRLMERLSVDGPEQRLRHFIDDSLPLPADAAEGVGRLRAALADCRGAGSEAPPPAEQIERLRPYCEDVFARRYDDALVRIGDLDTLAITARRFPDRSRFLAELVLDPPSGTADLAGPPHLDDDYLTLSTVHSAKGAEWRAVFVIHAADGNIPSDMALGEPGGLEEERRILYVALTRAKDHLAVTVPQRFYHRRFGGDPAHHYAPPSRFLSAADGHFVAEDAGPEVETEEAGRAAAGADPVAALVEDLLA